MGNAPRSSKRDSFHRENGFGWGVHIFQQKVLENHNEHVQATRPLWDERIDFLEVLFCQPQCFAE